MLMRGAGSGTFRREYHAPPTCVPDMSGDIGQSHDDSVGGPVQCDRALGDVFRAGGQNSAR